MTTDFSLTISYDDGSPATVVNNKDNVEVDVAHLNAAVISYTLKRPADVILEDGDTYTIDLPSFFEGSATDQNVFIYDVVVAKYSIIGNQAIITFKEEVEEFDDVELQLNLSGNFNTKVFEEEDEIDIEVPYKDGTKFTATIKAKSEDYVGQDKKEAGNPYVLVDGEPEYTTIDPTHIDWTVRVNDNAESIGEATVVDDLGANLTIVADSFKLYRIVRNSNNEETRVAVEVTTDMIEETDSGFKLKLGSIKDAYDVEYTTQITRPVGGGEHTINNSARIILDDSDKSYSDEFTGDWAKTLPVINKEGSYHESNPHLINWIVEYNYGQEDLGIVTLTDTLSANHGEIDIDSVEVYTVNVDRDGNVVGDPTLVTLVPVSNDGSVSFPDLDTTNGQAYLIKFSSNVPVGLNETITNTVIDNYLPEPNTDSASVLVNTIPEGGKVGNQHIDESGNPYIEWTITLNSTKVNVGSITVYDVFNKTHLNFDVNDNNLFKLYKDGGPADNNFVIQDYTHDDGREGFELTINNVGPSEYKFVYRTYYTTLGMQEPLLANEAELVFLDGNGFGIGEGQTVTKDLKGPKAGIRKSGDYTLNEVTKEQEINWSVVFNTSKILLKADDTLTEEFTSGNFEYIADSLILKSKSKTYDLGEDYTLEVNEDKKGFVVTLKKDTNDELTLTFRTTVDDEENKDHDNKATLKWRGGEETATDKVEYRKPGSDKNGSVIINADGSKTINWTVNFNTNKHVIHDFELTDTYTPATVTVSNIKITTGETDVTGQFTISPNTPESTGGTFTVSKDKLDAKEYQLTYSTTLSPEEEQQAIKNTANIEYLGGSETPSKEIASPSLGVEKDAVSIEKNDDNKLIIEWKILVNTDSANHLVNLVDAVLTDTIPSDQKLIGDTIKVVRADEKTDVVDPEKDIVYNDNEFTITLPNGAYQYTVTFNTEVLRIPSDDLEVFDKYNNSTTLENQTKDENGLKKSVSDSAWIRYYEKNKNELTGKSGEQNQDTENIDYIVTINPEGLTIHNAKVKDSLSWHHQYEALLDGETQLSVEDSISVTNSSNVKLVKGTDYVIEVAEDNNSFTISFVTTDNPDGVINETLTISYSTRLNPDVLGKYEVSNETVLTGGSSDKEMSKTTHSTIAQQWFYGGGGSGRVLDFSIKKVRPIVENKDSEILPGAKFKLIRISANGNETVVQEEIETTNDLFKAVGQRASRYKLIETSAPKGFINLTDPLYFTVGYSQDETAPYILTLTDSKWEAAENPNASAEGNILTIVNEYEPLKHSFNATKKLTGTDLVEGEFEFILKDSKGSEVGRAKNDSGGLVSFPELTFTQPGVYIYKMSEVDKGRTGMTYDKKEWTVTLDIVDGDEGLEVKSVDYENGTTETGNEFVNVYKPLPTKLALTANKTLTGRDIVDGEFTFAVYAVDEKGDRVGDVIVSATNVDNLVSFSDIEYDEVGTYKYVMVEVDGDNDTITYDDNEIYFTVTVADNEGQLVTSLSIKDNDAFNFENVYTPHPTSLELAVTKELVVSGRRDPEVNGRDLEADEYSFVVVDAADKVVATAINKADGSVSFSVEDYFTEVGTFVLTIREVVGEDATINYAANEITATVTVTDNEGQLVAAVAYDVEDPTFTNVEKTYAVGDFTWIDEDNQNGLQDDKEVLEGVIVELYEITEDGRKLIDSTTTDEKGLYLFDELLAGKYQIRFVLTEDQAKEYEFTKNLEGDDSTNDSDANPLTGWTEEFTLDDSNEYLSKEYSDQEFLATQGVDPTWDAGVVLRARTSVSVAKEWVGVAEESVTVTLYRQAEGSDVKESLGDVVLSDENNWTHIWEDLYVDVVTADGKVNYVYTVQETELDRYLTDITGDATEGFVITNTRKTYAIGDFTWIDLNKDGIQDEDEPILEGVIVELYDNEGNKLDETTTDEFGRYLFDELEIGTYQVRFILTPQQKELYEFTQEVEGENSVDNSDADVYTGWTVEIELNDDNEHLTLNEDYEHGEVKATMGVDPTWDAGVVVRAKTSVTVEKVWVGGPTEKPDVEVVLLRNGEQYGDAAILNDINDWTHTWEDLYVTDENRVAYEYTVAELTTEGYLVDITGDTDSGFVVTNTRKTYAVGDYTWVDLNKDGIQDEDEPVLAGVIVELYDDKGNKVGTTTTNEKGLYIFDELEAGEYTIRFVLTPEQKEKYEFTQEVNGNNSVNNSDANALTGWTKKLLLNEENPHRTTSYTDQEVLATMGIDPTWDAGVVLRERTEVTVKKVWVNAPTNKPSIKVQLYRNDVALGEPVTLDGTEATPWSYTFTDLYVTDENKVAYEYSVDEVSELKDYKKVVDGFVITNTYTKELLPDTGSQNPMGYLVSSMGFVLAGGYIILNSLRKKEDY